MKALKLLWAIADHPWTDEGAAVRIAMTVGGLEGQPWLGRVVAEGSAETPEAEAQAVKVEGRNVAAIHEDLSAGANVADAVALDATRGISCRGVIPVGKGFLVSQELAATWGNPTIVRPFRNGKDLTDEPRRALVIDTHGMTDLELRDRFPFVYQHLLEHVKPERSANRDSKFKEEWWLFGRARSEFRPALNGLSRYIVTPQVAKHRVFQFLSGDVLPDDKLIAIALGDAFFLGVLEALVHKVWAAANRGNMGVGNDSVYNKTTCFDPFPFPEATPAQKQIIRDLAERLDAHRKGAQARGVTITGMYNLLEKLRAMSAPSSSPSSPLSLLKKQVNKDEGDEGDKSETQDYSAPALCFTPKERELHALAQTEILRQLHDELDAAVAEAYGWPVDLSEPEILERLVALNRARAAEEARGLVRWLRPEYQAPQAAQPEATRILDLEPETAAVAAAPVESQPWPKELKAQLAALRGLLLASDRLWDLEAIATAFKSRGRYRDSIAAHLDLLADLGMVHRLDTPAGPRWCRPQALGA